MRRFTGWSTPTLLAAITLTVLLAACTNSSPQAGGTGGTPTLPSPTNSTPPTSPSPTLPAGFLCQGAHGGTAHGSDWGPAGPTVVAVRTGAQQGFDRFVLEFDGAIPTYKITLQGPTFTLDPKGTNVTLEGTAGVLITVRPENWTAYTGPGGMRPQLPFLRQARMVQNFEGTMQWGLGIQGSPCLHVTNLGSPPRLVVDVTSVSEA